MPELPTAEPMPDGSGYHVEMEKKESYAMGVDGATIGLAKVVDSDGAERQAPYLSLAFYDEGGELGEPEMFGPDGTPMVVMRFLLPQPSLCHHLRAGLERALRQMATGEDPGHLEDPLKQELELNDAD